MFTIVAREELPPITGLSSQNVVSSAIQSEARIPHFPVAFTADLSLNRVVRFFLQLEKIIGKLKAEKYGPKILDEIKNYESNDQIDNEFSGGGQDDGAGRGVKKLKTKKALVVIESSGDEA